MPQKFSLHIGIEKYSSSYYPNSANRLNGCINDMNAMKQLALDAGFPNENVHVLPDGKATQGAVQKHLLEVGKKMSAGDLFLFTFAGHGCQFQDFNSDERDGFDECICLHDGLMVDDMILATFRTFPEDARIVCIFDSCHSGSTISKKNLPFLTLEENEVIDSSEMNTRRMSEIERKYIFTYNQHQIEDELLKAKEKLSLSRAKAIGVSLSACGDGEKEKAYEANGRGLFSLAIESIFDKGKFSGTYDSLLKQVKQDPSVAAKQRPVILPLPSENTENQYFYKKEKFLSL